MRKNEKKIFLFINEFVLIKIYRLLNSDEFYDSSNIVSRRGWEIIGENEKIFLLKDKKK